MGGDGRSWTFLPGFAMVLGVKTEPIDSPERLPCFAGRELSPQELALVREVVVECGGLSRTELAQTVCELLDWRRPNRSLKGLECLRWLEELASCGGLELPAKRNRRPVGRGNRVPLTAQGVAGAELSGSVEDFTPVVLAAVETPSEQALFRELVGRYHPLGCRQPYGAQVRYLAWVSRPQQQVVGCVQFSSPAWRLAARDQWIGWDEATRRRNLQRVVQNSRYLILPWVRVKNLASQVLAQATRRLASDWRVRYGQEPWLVETLVDRQRFRGTCYLAANWQELGSTSGRGRMDRGHLRHGLARKTVLVYALVTDSARRLREG
jgi:Domain of unknown function (DUF4338)